MCNETDLLSPSVFEISLAYGWALACAPSMTEICVPGGRHPSLGYVEEEKKESKKKSRERLIHFIINLLASLARTTER